MSCNRVVVWFSCGAASAVAAKWTVLKYGKQTRVVYCDTGSEHPSNAKFLLDVQGWLGVDITILKSKRYKDIWDVFKKRRYLSGVKGALCTVEMKKMLRHEYQQPDDLQVFGFTVEEKARAKRFEENNPECFVEWPLIEKGYAKGDCLAALQRRGIELPEMYRLGYKNNNCIGCVKGQQGYWNKIRVDFPKTFDRMAKMERELNAAICKTYAGDGKRKRVFLDELDPKAGNYGKEPDISCGLYCAAELVDLEVCDQ